MRLTKPDFCSMQMLDKAIQERQNGINRAYFNSISAEWRSRVSVYVTHGGTPNLVPTWPEIEAHKVKFLNLYDSPAEESSQGIMLKSLRDEHLLRICPACGNIGFPTTLDHYLPKAKYPHFSITPANLSPMCTKCQGLKGEKTGNKNEPQFFIHPYFHKFTEFQILTLKISPPFNQPSFILSPHPRWTGWRLKLITSHMRELEIEKRYVNFFKAENIRLIRHSSIRRRKGQDVFDAIESKCEELEYPTKNSWEYIFYLSVLENEEFINYLSNEELPEYP